MRLFNLFQKNRPNSIGQRIDNCGIYSVNEFQSILIRARAQADRNGHCFSLVAFQVISKKGKRIDAESVAKTLSRRVRATDAVGWFDHERIGVYLFDMPANGAQLFGQEICNTCKMELNFQIYTYPFYYKTGKDSKKDCNIAQNGANGLNKLKNFQKIQYVFAGDDELPLSLDKWACQDSCLPAGVNIDPLEPVFGKAIPWWKRTIDVVGAMIVIVLCLPLFLAISLLIKIVSPGPIFFRQERIGYLGRRFTLCKFRTMYLNNDTSMHRDYLHQLIENGKSMTKLEVNSQIIPFGRLLRASGMDELPQLINVLRGEMSLIGPRPPIPYEVEKYHRWFHSRFDVMPGLTGLWQVSGKNKLSFREMIRLDIRYLKQLNIVSDIGIFLKTPLAILQQVISNFSLNKRSEKVMIEEMNSNA